MSITGGYVQDFALTLDKFLDHAAKWHPEAGVITATEDGAAMRVSYSELRVRCLRLSAALQALGLAPGDRVATLAWNTQSHVETWFALLGMGAVYHTLNPRLAVEHLASMVRQAECRMLVASVDLAPMAFQLARAASSIERIIVIDAPCRDLDAPVPVHMLEDLLAVSVQEARWGGIDEQEIAGLCFTSGTTGEPKGVVYTHRSSYLHTLRLLQADVIGPTSEDRILAVVPMFHANAWGLPFAAPAAGATLVLPGRHLDGASLARLIASEGVTIAAGVPTVWLGVVDHLDQSGEALPSLKRVLMGGAPLPQPLMDRIERRLDVTVQTSWGMTELSPLGTMAPSRSASRTAGNSGRPAVGVDLQVRDSDGQPLSQQRETEGRLYVRGASVVRRYLGKESPSVDQEGWFDTGDLARIANDGSLVITGRSKDLIKSGGEWINPGEIEAGVALSPAVALAAVIARRDAKWGERPVLIIELRSGSSVEDEELLQLLRGRIPSWWMPDAIIRVPRMPLAATGKIDKNSLRADFGD